MKRFAASTVKGSFSRYDFQREPNNGISAVKNFRTKLPLLKPFATIVDATYTGILKPDPRAYQQVADELRLPLEACVFVDDQLRNIAGARRAGMKTACCSTTRSGSPRVSVTRTPATRWPSSS